MAMTKAEMEHHWKQYDALLAEAHEAIEAAAYSRAVHLAMSAWDHIDGMIQYRRKYDGHEAVNIDAIHLVLRLAPMLFDFESLDKLESFLKGQRRIEKHSSADLSQARAKASERMWDAHRLWDHLEQHPNSRQDDLRRTLHGDQDQWRSLAETWEKMGLLSRLPEGGSYRLLLCTRMDEPVLAKCPSCAAVGKAPKSKFLDLLNCPKCHRSVSFVFLAAGHKTGD